MAIYYKKEKGDRRQVYEAAKKWKEECLLADRSLIWDGENVWTEQNMERFRYIFIERPDETGTSFDEKMEKQLSGEKDSVYKFVVELLYVYYLFPNSINYSTKMNKLKLIASWNDIDIDESLDIFKGLKDGLPSTGTFFMTSKYYELSYLFQICDHIKKKPVEERRKLLNDAATLKNFAEDVRENHIRKKVQMQHIFLHLLMPAKFERIASWGHKDKIVNTFDSLVTNQDITDTDKKLLVIREKLANDYGKPFDFYSKEIQPKWRPMKKSKPKETPIEGEDETIPPLHLKDTDLLDDSLIFENMDLLKERITTAILDGKHIMLMGPPGTGKSKLAGKIAEMFQIPSMMATASSNWSTYETIGGYRLDKKGNLYFDSGLFLECVKDKKSKKPQNKWLIIDEINRADIDKAFGSLFSVLTGDEVTLPFESKDGNLIVLKPQGKTNAIEVHDHTYVFPNDWRIIATMNTIDKAALYEMSYAFMRRFAFIPVGIPKDVTPELMEKYLHVWGLSNYPDKQTLISIWKIINDYRKIGPAIIEDIARYTEDNDDFASAVMLYVFPQFEGLPVQRIHEFINRLVEETDANVDRDQFDDFVDDFFDMGAF